jgi:hypothetical protein
MTSDRGKTREQLNVYIVTFGGEYGKDPHEVMKKQKRILFFDCVGLSQSFYLWIPSS